MENNFYIYVYLNPLKPGKFIYWNCGLGIEFDYEPFYIGKGHNNRYNYHLTEVERLKEQENFEEKSNNHKINTIHKILRNEKEPIIYKIISGIDSKNINLLEKLFIRLIGRDNKKLGPLTNLTNGGDGGDTGLGGKTYEEYYGEEKAKELKEKLKIKREGKTWEEFYGKEKAGEMKEKLSITKKKDSNTNKHLIGRRLSEEHKINISKSRIGQRTGKNNPSAKKYLLFSPEGKIHYLYGEFGNFCKENKLNPYYLRRVAKGILFDHEGWKCVCLSNLI